MSLDTKKERPTRTETLKANPDSSPVVCSSDAVTRNSNTEHERITSDGPG